MHRKKTKCNTKSTYKFWIKFMFTCVYILHRLTAAGNKTRIFTSPFHVSTNSSLTLAEAFRNDYVAACSTALRSATEENESRGYLTVPCPSKVEQHSNTTDWFKF